MKKFFLVLCVAVLLITSFGFSGCAKDKKIKLYFDGGGGSGNYNSTMSMVQSSANPYPYNTLEKMAKEWSQNNDTYEIVINKNSLNGNRAALTSMLKGVKAPDMIYQAGGVINDDIGNGWYVNLSDYLSKPNPYVADNAKWSDIYNNSELVTTKAADDNYYYVCLDKIPVGFMYNMDILKLAGITEVPNTFSEFINCLEQLKRAKESGAIANDVEMYCHQGIWSEIYLNNSVYGEKVAEWDIDGNRMVSTYELIKAYKENKWSLDDRAFNEYLKLCYDKAQYYPNNYLSYDTATKFSRGKLAITDGIGNNMRIASNGANGKFDLKISGYPILDSEYSEFGGYTGVRGSAGLSTAYWVTNSATKKGDSAVEACVNFLMYITAPTNNAKMVNDLGFALPLEVKNNTTTLFDGLVKQYEQDLKDPASLMWSAVNIWGSFGLEFGDVYEKAMGEFYQGKANAGNSSYVVNALKEKLPSTIDKLVQQYKWTF